MPIGLGSLDAQGVWRYGESDNHALFSDTLDVGQDSISTQFAADRARLDRRKLETYEWTNQAARTAQSGMSPGDEGIQLDTGVIYRYLGGGWKAWESDWITYTTTLTGVAVGTGGSALKSSQYRYEFGSIRVRFKFVLGTTASSVTADPVFTLPVNAAALDHTFQKFLCMCDLWDASAGSLPREAVIYSNGTAVDKVMIFGLGTSASGTVYNVNASLPFVWAVGDIMRGEFTYIPA